VLGQPAQLERPDPAGRPLVSVQVDAPANRPGPLDLGDLPRGTLIRACPGVPGRQLGSSIPPLLAGG